MPGWLTQLIRREWFLGALGGVVATVIGFVLAIMWDVHKTHTEDRERSQIAMTAIAEELALNGDLIKRNLVLLRREQDVLAEKKSVVEPLSLLKTSFWDVAKVNLGPKALPPGRLVKLRQAVSLVEQANDEIRSRETYRLHNSAMSNFHDHLALYDDSLAKALQDVNDAVAAFAASEGPIKP